MTEADYEVLIWDLIDPSKGGNHFSNKIRYIFRLPEWFFGDESTPNLAKIGERFRLGDYFAALDIELQVWQTHNPESYGTLLQIINLEFVQIMSYLF